jgi:hypothetical protein
VFYNKNKIKIKIKTPGTGQDSKSAWPDFLKGPPVTQISAQSLSQDFPKMDS